MTSKVRIVSRLCFLTVWFGIGWYPNEDVSMGILSASCAIILMELLYHWDTRTNGIHDIAKRVDFLAETLDGAADNEKLILEEIMIDAANIDETTEFGQGKKVGLDEAAGIVKHRFGKLFENLQSEGIRAAD